MHPAADLVVASRSDVSPAKRVAGGHAPTEAFVEIEPGLRLVASAPRGASDTLDEDLQCSVSACRAHHASGSRAASS
jgi:hypothetical protein